MKYSLILALALAGCSTLKTPTTVEIPVPVLCKTEDPVQPTYRFSPPYADSDLFGGVRDLLGDRDTALGYEIELRAALKSCK